MTNLVPFSFQSHQVRVIPDDTGAPWFIAKDVAESLGYSNTMDAVLRHCKKAKALKNMGIVKRDADTDQWLTLDPQTKVIPEGDVYRLIMRSKLPSAEAFESLMMDEILPTIRRTGSFHLAGQTPTAPTLPTPEPLPVEVRRAINRRANVLAHPTFQHYQSALESAVRQQIERDPRAADLPAFVTRCEVATVASIPPAGAEVELAAAHRELLRLDERWDTLRRCALAGLTLDQTAAAVALSASQVSREKGRMRSCGLLRGDG